MTNRTEQSALKAEREKNKLAKMKKNIERNGIDLTEVPVDGTNLWESLIESSESHTGVLNVHKSSSNFYLLCSQSLMNTHPNNSEVDVLFGMLNRYIEDIKSFADQLVALLTPHKFKTGNVIESEIMTYFGVFTELDGIMKTMIHTLERDKCDIAVKILEIDPAAEGHIQ